MLGLQALLSIELDLYLSKIRFSKHELSPRLRALNGKLIDLRPSLEAAGLQIAINHPACLPRRQPAGYAVVTEGERLARPRSSTAGR